MRRATGKVDAELGNIYPAICGRVELDRVARDVEKGLVRGLAVAQGLAQAGESLAKVVPCGFVRDVGPEQARERISTVARTGFHG